MKQGVCCLSQGMSGPRASCCKPRVYAQDSRCGLNRTALLAAYWHDVFLWCYGGFWCENGHLQALQLPVLMQTLTPDEETCDPMTRNCQTPMHVWETKCTSCYGSGEASVQLSSSSAVPAHHASADQVHSFLLVSQSALLCPHTMSMQPRVRAMHDATVATRLITTTTLPKREPQS